MPGLRACFRKAALRMATLSLSVLHLMAQFDARCFGADKLAAAPAAEAILAAFDRYQIVGYGELHGNEQSHALIRTITADKIFPDKVHDIVVEFGSADYQAVIDRYIAGQHVSNDELRNVWRNTVNVFTWDSPLYEEFFRHIRQINLGLAPSRRIRVWLGDPPVGWEHIDTAEDLVAAIRRHRSRDYHCFEIVKKQILDHGRKAFVVYGADHIRRGDPALDNSGHEPIDDVALAQLIEKEYPGQMYCVYPAQNMSPGMKVRAEQWPIPSLVNVSGTALAKQTYDTLIASPVKYRYVEDERQDLPAGDSPKWPRVGEVFDGCLYLGPAQQFTWRPAAKSTYNDETYVNELRRRVRILWAMNKGSEESMKAFFEGSSGVRF